MSYCSKACQKLAWRQHKQGCGGLEVVQVVEVEGRGRGLVTKQRVVAGQLLVKERAVMVLEQGKVWLLLAPRISACCCRSPTTQ